MNIQLIGSKFPCSIFNRSAITRGIIVAYFFSSHFLFLFPIDKARQIPKQLFLGQYLLNRKKEKEERKKKR